MDDSAFKWKWKWKLIVGFFGAVLTVLTVLTKGNCVILIYPFTLGMETSICTLYVQLRCNRFYIDSYSVTRLHTVNNSLLVYTNICTLSRMTQCYSAIQVVLQSPFVWQSFSCHLSYEL